MRVILLNGPPRCGKDTAQGLLPGYMEKLSWPLKKGVQAIFDPFMSIDIPALERSKEQPYPFLLGQTYREAQINLFKMLALHHGEGILGRLLVNRLVLSDHQIRNMHRNLVTVSDSGRRVECIPIVEHVGVSNVIVVQIRRNDTSYDGDIRETIDLTDMGVPQVVVDNNGSPEQLCEKIIAGINMKWTDVWH